LWDVLDKQNAKLAKPGPARVIYELAQNGKGPPPQDDPDSPLPADAGRPPFGG
jgi:hypothetical protein